MENTLTVNALITKYSAWCSKHRAPRSHDWYRNYHKNFLAYPGIAEIEADKLKPFHIMEWLDSKEGWGDNYRRGAIISIQRVYNWSIEMGYLETSPIRKVPKPMAKRREIYMKPEDYEQILGMIKITDPFRDLFMFCWYSGCRIQEARHIELRHIEIGSERIVFSAEESKGKRTKRVIYLQGITLEIIQRLMAIRTEGKLFRNKRGTAWSKYAVCNRMQYFSKNLGRRMFMYAARHGFGTRKLIQGHDHLTVAAIMGHSDGSMLAKIYSHVSDDEAHLKRALID